MSPTMMSAAWSGTAFSSACMSRTSTIDASSKTRRSQSRQLPSLRLKPPVLGSTSRSRWMVLASIPVASVIRLAARPVGAQSNILTPLTPRMRKIELTMVVLPTPGPPVMTSALLISANRIASRWLSASLKLLRSSTHAMALDASIDGQGSFPLATLISRSAMLCSARKSPARNTQSVLPTLSETTAPSERSRSRRS